MVISLSGKDSRQCLLVHTVKHLSKVMKQATSYRLLNISGEDKYTETPDKNRYSHPHDANQYLCLGAMPDFIQTTDHQH